MSNSNNMRVKLNFDNNTLPSQDLESKQTNKVKYRIITNSINKNPTVKYINNLKSFSTQTQSENDYYGNFIDLEQNHNTSNYEINIKKLYSAFKNELNQIIWYNRYSKVHRNSIILEVTKEELLSIDNLSSQTTKRIINAFDNVFKSKGWDLIEPIILSFDRNQSSGKFSNSWLWDMLDKTASTVEPTKHLKLSILTQHFQPTISILLTEQDVIKISEWFINKIKKQK